MSHRLVLSSLFSLLLLSGSTRGEEVHVSVDEEPQALYFSRSNPILDEALLQVSAGSVWQAPDGARYVILRRGEMKIEAKGAASMNVPAAVLSQKTPWGPRVGLVPRAETEPRLQPLLEYLATRDDVPRRTSQLVVLALLENIDFPKWQQCAAARVAPTSLSDLTSAPTRETATALDALSILKTITPDHTFALAADPALKLRALHDPALRPRALQLYGMTIPGDAPPGGVAPSLGQLMHTAPGDNCPNCRLRQQMQPKDDAP